MIKRYFISPNMFRNSNHQRKLVIFVVASGVVLLAMYSTTNIRQTENQSDQLYIHNNEEHSTSSARPVPAVETSQTRTADISQTNLHATPKIQDYDKFVPTTTVRTPYGSKTRINTSAHETKPGLTDEISSNLNKQVNVTIITSSKQQSRHDKYETTNTVHTKISREGNAVNLTKNPVSLWDGRRHSDIGTSYPPAYSYEENFDEKVNNLEKVS